MPDDTRHDFMYTGNKADRLDRIIRAQAGDGLSREKIKKQIQSGACLVDGAICRDPSTRLLPGRHVVITIPPEVTSLEAEAGDVRIIWQDTHLMVVDKPAGLTVHPAPSCPQGTLIQRLLAVCSELGRHEGWRPGIVHRLDKDTSGLIVIAPDEAARLGLAKAFAAREVGKTYLALVSGVMHPASGACYEPIGRHPVIKTRMAVVANGRPAHTEWETLHADPAGRFTLLSIRLHTGRTHQIRVHMTHLGHPLLGDAVYAPSAVAALADRQMLHAWKLCFDHPITGEPCAFTSPPPEDMLAVMQRLGRHTERVVITGLPGCGKSRLTRMMADEGYPVWSADDVVRASYEPGGDGWQILHHRFRGRFTATGQAVDKTALAAAIRETPGMREELEALVHPLVNADLLAFWKQAERDGATLAFAEVPLWLECGGSRPKYGKPFGRVCLVGVSCPTGTRHERLIGLRGWSEDMVRAADSWQWPEAKKIAACDHVVDNSGDVPHLLDQGKRLIARLLTAQAARSETIRHAMLQGIV